MRNVLVVLAVATVVLAGAANAVAAVIDVPVTPLVIRLYADPPLPEASQAAALDEARTILSSAGLGATWLVCAPSGAPATPCSAPLHGAELAVRIVAAAPRQRGGARQTLGYSLLDPRTKSGTLATVFMDRVLWLADAAGSDRAALLGRAIAHEIGHLLLGTTAHAADGVMRAVWSRDVVRSAGDGEWRFAPQDARRMRAAVSARSEVMQVARR